MDRLWTPWRYAYITGEKPENARKGVPADLAAWPGDHDCVFCNMLGAADWAMAQGMDLEKAERAIYLLERGKSCFTVLNGFPYNNGHLMVVPYQHESSLAALPQATAQEIMHMARRAETALRSAYKPHGLNFGLNLGEAAGAGVAAHLHLHGVPRWNGDTNFMTVVGETRVLPEMLQESWERLRQTLRALPQEPEEGAHDLSHASPRSL